MSKKNSEKNRHPQKHQGPEFGHEHLVQEREQFHHTHIDHAKEHARQAQEREYHAHHQQHAQHARNPLEHKPLAAGITETGPAERKALTPLPAADREVLDALSGKSPAKMALSDIDQVGKILLEVNQQKQRQGHAHEDLARVAYFLYLERGALNGHDMEDWLRAEAILSRNGAQR